MLMMMNKKMQQQPSSRHVALLSAMGLASLTMAIGALAQAPHSSRFAYDGMRPVAAIAQGARGHAVIAWSEGVVLKTQFRR